MALSEDDSSQPQLLPALGRNFFGTHRGDTCEISTGTVLDPV